MQYSKSLSMDSKSLSMDPRMLDYLYSFEGGGSCAALSRKVQESVTGGQTDKQTDTHTGIATYRLNQPSGRFNENNKCLISENNNTV